MDELGLGPAKPLIDLDPTLPAVLADKSAILASATASGSGAGEELYAKWKRLEGHEEFLDLQEVRRTMKSGELKRPSSRQTEAVTRERRWTRLEHLLGVGPGSLLELSHF